jgi:hypothetical protein
MRIKINNPHKPVRVENCVIEGGGISIEQPEHCHLPLWRRVACWLSSRWPLGRVVGTINGRKIRQSNWLWMGHRVIGNRFER